ncbi:hypothetical protein GOODEAATRI_006495 [Goodea atripinnis]|uniref:Uncharacterized protein n=1 Tax=Goodea atripinnis TaxID=208336 RepID=A0ABV0P3X3_9TELE
MVLLIHFSTHFVQYTRTTGSQTALKHDATITMLGSCYRFLRLSLTSTPRNIQSLQNSSVPYSFVFSDYKTFLLKTFGLSMSKRCGLIDNKSLCSCENGKKRSPSSKASLLEKFPQFSWIP